MSHQPDRPASPRQPGETRSALTETVFVGRTAAAYELLFDIESESLVGERVLDCPGGPCLFTAAAARQGVDAVAVDPVYSDPDRVARHVERGIETLRAKFAVEGRPEAFCWAYYDGPESLLDRFATTGERFLSAYRAHRSGGRYLRGALPELPFPDGAFDRVLSGHLLCLYGERFSYEFHEQSLHELCRVSSREVRVAPVTEQRRARRYRHLDRLRASLEAVGYETRLQPSRLPFFSSDPELLVVEV